MWACLEPCPVSEIGSFVLDSSRSRKFGLVTCFYFSEATRFSVCRQAEASRIATISCVTFFGVEAHIRAAMAHRSDPTLLQTARGETSGADEPLWFSSPGSAAAPAEPTCAYPTRPFHTSGCRGGFPARCLGLERPHPAGMNDNSPPFQWWEAWHCKLSSSEGTAEGRSPRISFAPDGAWGRFGIGRPTIEMVGYCRPSLRDKTTTPPFRVLARLGFPACATAHASADAGECGMAGVVEVEAKPFPPGK